MEKLSVMAGAASVLLKDRRETVAVAESSAGGLVAAALVAVPGASAYFLGGGVIYTREARHALLGFSREASTMRGATEEYAIHLPSGEKRASSSPRRRAARWIRVRTAARRPWS